MFTSALAVGSVQLKVVLSPKAKHVYIKLDAHLILSHFSSL